MNVKYGKFKSLSLVEVCYDIFVKLGMENEVNFFIFF